MMAAHVLLAWPLGALAALPALLAGVIVGLVLGKHPHSRLKPWSQKTSELMVFPFLLFYLSALAMLIISMGEYP